MKKKTLLSSILVIALCLSLIAGSTFALFTSESKVNAAFTAGNVDIVATIENEIYWSTLGALLPESKCEVSTEKNTITLNLMAPGDVLEFDIVLTNNSDLSVYYRTIVAKVADAGLWNGLVVTIDDVTFTGTADKYSDWDLITPAEDGATVHVRVELPETAGNEYETTSCEFSYSVQAVQGNANLLASTADVQGKLDNGGLISQFNDTLALNDMLGLSENATTFSAITLDGSNIPDSNANGETPAVLMSNTTTTDITLSKDATIIAPDGNNKLGIFYFYNQSNKLTIEEGAKIVADGTGSACIQIYDTTLDLYLADAAALEATNGAWAIMVGSSAVLNITVPNATVEADVNAMIANGLIANDGTAVTINVTIG